MIPFALLFASLILVYQEPGMPPAPRTITIRLLDGRTGKPIITDEAEVWIDKDQSHVLTVHAALDGIATVQVPSGVTEVYVTARQDGWYLNHCEVTKEKPVSSFSMEQITKDGVVSANRCSRKTAVARPGELTMFLHYQNIWDKMKS